MSDAIDLLADQRQDECSEDDLRAMAIYGCKRTLMLHSERFGNGTYNLAIGWKLHPAQQAHLDASLRILRHYGLLIEHGEGVVSIKENGNA